MGHTQTYDEHYGFTKRQANPYDDPGARAEMRELDRELKKGNWGQRFEMLEIKVARLEVEIGFIGASVLGTLVLIALKIYGVT